MSGDVGEHQHAKTFLVDSFLKLYHETLRWTWLVIMGASIIAGVRQVYPSIKNILYAFLGNLELDEMLTFADIGPYWITLLLFALGFLPTFFRFTLGNNRYLDLKYMELMFLRDYSGNDFERYIAEFSVSKRLWDAFMLMTKGVFFVGLARSTTEPLLFIFFFILLLAFNVVWLSFNARGQKTKMPGQFDLMLVGLTIKETQRRNWRCDRNWAAKCWIGNNSIFATALMCLLILFYRGDLHQDLFIYLCISAIFLNSLADFLLTWKFYFPYVPDIYQKSIEVASE